MSIIYLDNASSTPINKVIVSNLNKYFEELYANPSSVHTLGLNAKKTLENEREDIRKILCLDSDKKIVFTSCATESNNIVFQSLLKKNKGRIISTKTEHPSVEENLKMLSYFGYEIVYIDIKNGVIDLESLLKNLTPNTQLVSIIHTNNVFGVVNNIQKAASYTLSYSKKIGRKILFHTDTTQSLLKRDVDYNAFFEAGVDALTFSSHKCFSPRGCGLLITSSDVITPLTTGGGQEKGMRGGTENLFSICAFRDALFLEMKDIKKNIECVKKLNNFITEELLKIGFKPIYNDTDKVPHITSFYQKWLPSEVLSRLFSENGVCIGTLSACSSNKNNNTIKSIERRAENSIRVSLSHYNTEEEINSFICIAKNIIEKFKY